MKLSAQALLAYSLSRPNPNKFPLTKTIGTLFGGTVLSLWGIGFIPIDRLPLPGYWIGIIYRTCSGLIWIKAAW